MKPPLHEKPFMINGVASPIHCLYLEKERRKTALQPLYHWHEYIELLYALDTDAFVWINDKCQKFTAGDLVIVNTPQIHDVTFASKSTFICIKFSPGILYSDEQTFFELKYVVPFLTKNSYQNLFHKGDIPMDIESLMLEMINEFESQDVGFELIIRSNILKIISGILRFWQKQNIITPDISLNNSIKKALIYIDENYMDLCAKDVAQHCGLSYNHFSTVFKNTIGKSFGEYITFKKLKEAEKLLISTDLSITDIAMSAGFSSASHFISRFKENKGITPKNFRNNAQYLK